MADSESRLFQYFVQAFLAYLRIYHPRTGNQPCHYIRRFLTAFHDRGKCTEILDTAVGASTQEHVINLLAQQRFTRPEAHILHRLHKRCLGGLAHALGSGDVLRDAHAHTRIGSVGNHRLDVGGVEAYFLIEHGILIAFQCFPVCQRLVPRFAFRSIFASLDVPEGRFVRSNHTAARTHFYAEVAQRKASFHGQAAHRLSGILHKVARSAAGSHFGHHIERHIFGGHPFTQFAVYGDAHRFGTGLQNTLRSHHHLHFARTDAESHRPHCAVSGRMRVTAYNRHARQGQPPFRTHHMDNAVLLVHHAEMLQSKIFRILGKRIHLRL